MKILMCTSESTPLAKSGGLADVVHALSQELIKQKNEVIIIMPFFKSIKNKNFKFELVDRIFVQVSWRNQECAIYKTIIDGITYILLDNARYFDRDNLYGYMDDTERFALLSSAIRTVIKHIGFKPDIIHCHDWHVGMVPTLIKEQNANDPFYKDIKYVLTIHNPAFKGVFNPYILGDMYGLDEEVFSSGRIRFQGQVSTLKAAIMYCDKVTTVSPTHAEELLSFESVHDLQEVLKFRKDDFIGILNGIDYIEFDPLNDKSIIQNYDLLSFEKGKELNKKDVLELFNLKDENRPLFGMVSRLTWQKGLDLVINACRHVLENGGNVVILGSGEYNYEQELEKLRAQYPDHMGIYIGYSDEIAHKIYAGADFFFMPSLFEPCGIGQMISLRYGTLPIVRLTGGLKDTIYPLDDRNIDIANGFGFFDYDNNAMISQTSLALETYKDKLIMKKLINNAMSCINNWEKSTKEYIKLYKEAQKKK